MARREVELTTMVRRRLIDAIDSIKQQDLVILTGIPQYEISKLKSSRKWITYARLERIADKTKFMKEWILTGKAPQRVSDHDLGAGIKNELAETQPSLIDAGIRELSLSDFHREDNFNQEATRFLRGHAPTPSTAALAAVERPVSIAIAKLERDFDILVVHGPVGEGTSTVLLQVAHMALQCGQRVFRIANPEAFLFAAVAIPWEERPLVIFDDAHRLTQLPLWLLEAYPDDTLGCIVLGTQTRKSSGLLQLLRSGCTRSIKDVRLAPVRSREADQFVDVIMQYGAAPEGATREHVKSLFVDGLQKEHGLAGLWPAQYQATHGILLDHRISEMFNEFDIDTKRVVSILAFLGASSHFSPDPRFPIACRSLVEHMLEHLGLSTESAAKCVAMLPKLFSRLEGELRHSGHSEELLQLNNPELEFRHPALAESMFRWCFGAQDPARGEFVFEKWPYYNAVTAALSIDATDTARWLAYAVLQGMVKGTMHDHRTKSELTSRLKDRSHPKVGDRILRAIEHAEVAFGHSVANGGMISRRLNVMKARTLISDMRHDGHSLPLEDRHAACQWLEAALANAFEETDDTVLRYAADVAQKLDYKFQHKSRGLVDWRDMIEAAEEFEAKRSSRRPTRAICDYLWLALNKRDPRGKEQLLKILDRAQVMDSQEWNETRLECLVTLLGWFRREDSRNRLIYLLPKCSTDPRLSSIQAIYRSIWHELRRKDKVDPNFRKLHAFGNASKNSWTRNVISGTLMKWFIDFEEDDESWPEGVIELVDKARDDPKLWLSFIEAYDRYFGATATEQRPASLQPHRKGTSAG